MSSSMNFHGMHTVEMKANNFGDFATLYLRLDGDDSYTLSCFLPASDFAKYERAANAFNAALGKIVEPFAPSLAAAAE